MPVQPDSAMPYSNDRSQENQSTVENRLDQTAPAALPSCGELERSVGQALQKAYRQYLGHLPSRVSCHLFANKLSIWIENSLTPVESILLASSTESSENGSSPDSDGGRSVQFLSQNLEECQLGQDSSNGRYLQEVRVAIDRAMRRRLSQIIEDCLGVSVTTIITGTCYDQRCTSLSVMLSDTPAVRNPERVPKTTASRQFNRKSAVKAEAAS